METYDVVSLWPWDWQKVYSQLVTSRKPWLISNHRDNACGNAQTANILRLDLKCSIIGQLYNEAESDLSVPRWHSGATRTSAREYEINAWNSQGKIEVTNPQHRNKESSCFKKLNYRHCQIP